MKTLRTDERCQEIMGDTPERNNLYQRQLQPQCPVGLGMGGFLKRKVRQPCDKTESYPADKLSQASNQVM